MIIKKGKLYKWKDGDLVVKALVSTDNIIFEGEVVSHDGNGWEVGEVKDGFITDNFREVKE